jgi:RNA polymerase sigma-70 factor (ECF subfamily)
VDALVRQDRDAFRRWVETESPHVFALLSRVLGPSAAAATVDDLAQETFHRAHQALPRFDPHGTATLRTWLLTIATRLALSKLRTERRLRAVPVEADALVHPSAPTPEESAHGAQLRAHLHAAIASLDDDQRAVFVMVELSGCSLAEAADAAGVPLCTAKTRLFRARAKLREALRPWLPSPQTTKQEALP